MRKEEIVKNTRNDKTLEVAGTVETDKTPRNSGKKELPDKNTNEAFNHTPRDTHGLVTKGETQHTHTCATRESIGIDEQQKFTVTEIENM